MSTMITPPNSGLGKVAKSSRGLELVRFKDALGVPCVVQSVTLAYSENGLGIAIGAEKAKPKLQARDARALGIKTVQKTGFVAFPVPDEVSFDTRAVLTRRQAELLVLHLNAWLYGGGTLVPIQDADKPRTVKEADVIQEGLNKIAIKEWAAGHGLAQHWAEDGDEEDDPAEDPHTREQIMDAASEATRVDSLKLSNENTK
jgi:hypothetical protein